MRRLIILAVASAGALLVVSGCTASSKNASGGSTGGGAGGASAPAAGAASPEATNRKSAGDSGFTAPLPTRALVKTADLTVRVANVDQQAARAVNLATSLGGSVDADERSGSGSSASAQLTLEVPPDSLENVLDRLVAGGKASVRKTSTQDVTAQVADVTARLASMRASLARVRALYARATPIGDVIKIESELATREAGLESMEAQQVALGRQTAMAVVHLQLLAKQAVAAAPHKHPRSALGGFVVGWHAFTRSARWTLTAFGTVLPFLVIVSALALGGLWLRRRHASAAQSRPVEGS